MSKQCDRPPAGWSCSREAGHPGPCAARPVKGILDMGLEVLRFRLYQILRDIKARGFSRDTWDFKEEDGLWYWERTGKNNERVGRSEQGFSSKQMCENNAYLNGWGL